jgi:hypothetical protein
MTQQEREQLEKDYALYVFLLDTTPKIGLPQQA